MLLYKKKNHVAKLEINNKQSLSVVYYSKVNSAQLDPRNSEILNQEKNGNLYIFHLFIGLGIKISDHKRIMEVEEIS